MVAFDTVQARMARSQSPSLGPKPGAAMAEVLASMAALASICDMRAPKLLAETAFPVACAKNGVQVPLTKTVR